MTLRSALIVICFVFNDSISASSTPDWGLNKGKARNGQALQEIIFMATSSAVPCRAVPVRH